ncbi:MAG: FtsB family cell division protein [Promethearchaeota archaeon]
MNKTKTFFKQIGSFLTTLIILAVIVFIIYNIYKSTVQNYQINKQITELENQIQEIKKQNQYLKNLIIYYNTDTFKELELRRKIGMKKPDEVVLIMPENKNQKEQKEPNEPMYKEQNNKKEVQEPNYQKWLKYITGK